VIQFEYSELKQEVCQYARIYACEYITPVMREVKFKDRHQMTHETYRIIATTTLVKSKSFHETSNSM